MSESKITGTGIMTGVRARATTRTMQVLLFAALTAIGAQIEIPHSPVPFTLQTFFVLLSGALLGPWLGACSMLVYLAAGVAGLPVFSSLGFGFARLVGPTGGYLLAFPAASFAVGYLAGSRPNLPRLLLSMTAALLVIFSLGTVQLNLVWFHDWPASFANGFLIFSWWDVVKLAGAASIARAVGRSGFFS